MGLSISADCDMAISWRDSFRFRRLSNDDNTTPTSVAGQFQCGALILLTLLGEVDCCYNFMTSYLTISLALF